MNTVAEVLQRLNDRYHPGGGQSHFVTVNRSGYLIFNVWISSTTLKAATVMDYGSMGVEGILEVIISQLHATK